MCQFNDAHFSVMHTFEYIQGQSADRNTNHTLRVVEELDHLSIQGKVP